LSLILTGFHDDSDGGDLRLHRHRVFPNYTH
jgi:hypothetical protein